MRRSLSILLILSLGTGRAAAAFIPAPPTMKKKAQADPFCITASLREEQKRKLKDKIDRPDCAAYLRKLRLARLECSEPQTIRDFKSAMLAAVSPDDAYAEGFARAVCPGKADAACMNPEPQCRLKAAHPEPKVPAGPPDAKFRERLIKYYRDRLSDVSDGQARTMADHYLELHGSH